MHRLGARAHRLRGHAPSHLIPLGAARQQRLVIQASLRLGGSRLQLLQQALVVQQREVLWAQVQHCDGPCSNHRHGARGRLDTDAHARCEVFKGALGAGEGGRGIRLQQRLPRLARHQASMTATGPATSAAWPSGAVWTAWSMGMRLRTGAATPAAAAAAAATSSTTGCVGVQHAIHQLLHQLRVAHRHRWW